MLLQDLAQRQLIEVLPGVRCLAILLHAQREVVAPVLVKVIRTHDGILERSVLGQLEHGVQADSLNQVAQIKERIYVVRPDRVLHLQVSDDNPRSFSEVLAVVRLLRIQVGGVGLRREHDRRQPGLNQALVRFAVLPAEAANNVVHDILGNAVIFRRLDDVVAVRVDVAEVRITPLTIGERSPPLLSLSQLYGDVAYLSEVLDHLSLLVTERGQDLLWRITWQIPLFQDSLTPGLLAAPILEQHDLEQRQEVVVVGKIYNLAPYLALLLALDHAPVDWASRVVRHCIGKRQGVRPGHITIGDAPILQDVEPVAVLGPDDHVRPDDVLVDTKLRANQVAQALEELRHLQDCAILCLEGFSIQAGDVALVHVLLGCPGQHGLASADYGVIGVGVRNYICAGLPGSTHNVDDVL